MTLRKRFEKVCPTGMYNCAPKKKLPVGCPTDYPFLNASKPKNCPYVCDTCWNREFVDKAEER